MLSYIDIFKGWRYRSLLFLLLTTVLLQPFLSDFMIGQALLILAYGAVLSGGIYATRPPAWLSASCLVFAVFLVALSWYGLFTGKTTTSPLLIIITIIFGFFAISRTLAALVSAPAAHADALAGAVFGYFLLVVVWALLYRALEAWSPGAFDLSSHSDPFTELLYFSLVTITTLGYGDISPLAPFARVSAGLEAATGTLYVAILIARIVGALGARSE